MTVQIDEIIKNIELAQQEIDAIVDCLINDNNLFLDTYNDLGQAKANLGSAKYHVQAYNIGK